MRTIGIIVKKNRPQAGDDDAPIDFGQTGTVDLGCFDYAVVYSSKPSEKQGHDKPGGLPDPCDDHRINRHFGIDQPVEAEAFKAEITDQFFQAQSGI